MALIVCFISTNAFAWADYHNHTHHNDNSVTANGGAGGNATIEPGAVVNNNSNVIQEGAIKNKNVNKNKNTNVNLNCNSNKNVNKNTNKQGQMQGQMQGQGQGQGQGQMNDWTQIYEDKRDHIQGPEVVRPDVKFQKNKVYTAKTKGLKGFFTNIKSITWKQSKKLSKGASDVDVAEAVLFENEFSTNKVHLNGKSSGDYMGTLTLTPDGSDVTSLGMIGVAAKKAMELGATGMKLIYAGYGVTADGSAWNIGLGGGASIMANGDATAIAPNGGLGYGEATTQNEARPDMVFELYFDKALVK